MTATVEDIKGVLQDLKDNPNVDMESGAGQVLDMYIHQATGRQTHDDNLLNNLRDGVATEEVAGLANIAGMQDKNSTQIG